MKNLFKLFLLSAIMFSSCDDTDLDPIQDKLDELEQRTEDLEALTKAHDELLKAQENQIQVVSIVNMDNGIELTMSDGTKIFVPSEDSFTPYIGENNNWWINGEDTGIKAKGENGTDGQDGTNGAEGLTPYIGENGNWFIGNVDTGIAATGKDGVNGTDGQDGTDGADAPKIVSIQYIKDDVIFHFSDGSKISLTMENAEEIQKEKDWQAVKTNGGYQLITYKGSDVNVVIPNTIYGEPVVCIGINGSTSDEYSLIPKKMRLLVTSINLSEVESLTSINDYALAGLSKITEITLPKSLLTINENSFDSCIELTTVTISNDNEAYTTCRENSFANTPIKIGKEGSKIVYPAGTPYPTIDFWFKNLAEFYDSDGNAYGIPVGTEITEGDWTGVVVAGGIQLTLYSGDDKDVIVPNKLKNINVVSMIGRGDYKGIFRDGWNDYYLNIDMSNCQFLEKLESETFMGCGELTTVILPESLKEIGYAVFYECLSLTTVNLPQNLTKIGNYAFRFCRYVSSYNFPTTLETIGMHAFINNFSLTEIVLPENLQSIGDGAFKNCNILTSVTIKKSDTPLTTSFANSFEETPIIEGTNEATIYYPTGTNYPNENGWVRNQCNWVIQ